VNVIIDANIIKWYESEVTGLASPATHPPSALINQLGSQDLAFIDQGGHIESEWRNVTDPDWFSQWFPNALISGAIVAIPVHPAAALLRRLHVNFGFPRSRDVWYLSTAKTVVEAQDPPVGLITEDMDFYDPREKRCSAARRNRILEACSGNVARELQRREGIVVRSLIAHCG
jgi:hypothetical protein